MPCKPRGKIELPDVRPEQGAVDHMTEITRTAEGPPRDGQELQDLALTLDGTRDHEERAVYIRTRSVARAPRQPHAASPPSRRNQILRNPNLDNLEYEAARDINILRKPHDKRIAHAAFFADRSDRAETADSDTSSRSSSIHKR
jgi:hypothetical protein